MPGILPSDTGIAGEFSPIAGVRQTTTGTEKCSPLAQPGADPSINVSVHEIIGAANGEKWLGRWALVHKGVPLEVLQEHLARDAAPNQTTDLSGSEVYMRQEEGETETRYDIVNRWQVNYVRGLCALDGTLLQVSKECYNDEAFFADFYSERCGARVLDVGCNTGKNMARALRYGGPGTEAYGIEYSADSVALAREVHGKDRVFQGDASKDFVQNLSWYNKFSVAQCTAVIQHMTPDQVEAAFGHIASCLVPDGELVLTFKDAPTGGQMQQLGMGHWNHEVFTADMASRQDYLRDGFLRAVMWDDDYYPGVTSDAPPEDRDLRLQGIHRREFVFYSLGWIKAVAMKHGLFAERVEVHPDSKIPYSALHWMVVFRYNVVCARAWLN